jgi:hypothetical protein
MLLRGVLNPITQVLKGNFRAVFARTLWPGRQPCYDDTLDYGTRLPTRGGAKYGGNEKRIGDEPETSRRSFRVNRVALLVAVENRGQTGRSPGFLN